MENILHVHERLTTWYEIIVRFNKSAFVAILRYAKPLAEQNGKTYCY